MNRLVIVGNGFDLAHGLKTTYIDFLSNYLIHSLEVALLKSDSSGYSDPLIQIEQIAVYEFKRTISLSNLNNLETVKTIKDFTLYNGQYMLKVKSQLLAEIFANIEQTNWVDIEKTYSILLESYILEISNMHFRKDKIEFYQKIEILNNEFDFMKNNIENYIRWIDNQYAVKTEQSDKIDKLLFGKSIRNDIDLNKDRIFVLSFNYTNLINRYVDLTKHNFQLKFIHGNIRNNGEPILFGHGDIKSRNYQLIIDENNVESMRFFKSMITTSNNSYESLKTFINSSHFETIVAGHSCGNSDSYVLREIINHDNCYSIKLLHYKKENGESDYHEKYSNLAYHFKNIDFSKEKILLKNDQDILML